jgi:release factor glutamine methyltransferase
MKIICSLSETDNPLENPLFDIDFYADGNEVESFFGEESKEKFICSLKKSFLITDLPKIINEFNSSEDYARRELLNFLQQRSKIITTIFQDVSVNLELEETGKVWGPSIDTLFIMNGIRHALNGELSRASSVCEVGCASGMIIKCLLNSAPNARGTAIDINPQAMVCTSRNTKELNGRLSLIVGDILEMDPGRFDVVVSNPPYIDRPLAEKGNHYEGKHVIDKLLKGSLLNPGGTLLLNISSLSGYSADMVKGACDENGLSCEAVSMMVVPMKLPYVINNKQWLEYLLNNNLIRDNFIHGHKYWHKLTLYRIRKL